MLGMMDPAALFRTPIVAETNTKKLAARAQSAEETSSPSFTAPGPNLSSHPPDRLSVQAPASTLVLELDSG